MNTKHSFDEDAICRSGFDGAEWHHWRWDTWEGRDSQSRPPICKTEDEPDFRPTSEESTYSVSYKVAGRIRFYWTRATSARKAKEQFLTLWEENQDSPQPEILSID